jgi:hypothetical protein
MAAATSAVPDFSPAAAQPLGDSPAIDGKGDALYTSLSSTTDGTRNIPRLLQVQACRPEVVTAELNAIETVFRPGDSKDVSTTVLAEFFRIVAYGLGLPTESPAFSTCSAKILHPAMADSRPTEQHVEDPGNDLVTRSKGGDLTAFSELIHIYGRRVYRTLVGLLGDPDEALDAMQDTFLSWP